MENRSVLHVSRQQSLMDESTDETVASTFLSQTERHALAEFFQLLDRWDRELVQNGNGRNEVILCRAQ